MKRNLIPQAVVSLTANLVSDYETHTTLDSLFIYAGASGDPPNGSKQAKALEWLRKTNKDPSVNPIDVIGKIIESYFEEVPDDPDSGSWREKTGKVEAVKKALANSGYTYQKGGRILSGAALPSVSLEEKIRYRDFDSINFEFDRAIKSIDSEPKEAISAACNILESTFKVFIEDEGLSMPSKQDINPVWNVVKEELGFDPKSVEDNDLKLILGGIANIVHGVGALRTHASTAHGPGRTVYRIESRHARLSVHAAHTLVLFVLES